MKLKKLHITILFLLMWGVVFSQETQNYSVKNGLPSNHVYRITQDHEGCIWITTDKGMVKFDGNIFKTFNTQNGLPNNDIWDIKITKDNKKWFFTKANKLGYIKNDSVFTFASDLNQIMFPRIIKKHQNTVSFSDGIRHYSLKNNQWKTQSETQFSAKKNPFKEYDDTVYQRINPFKKLQGTLHEGQINDSLHVFFSDNTYDVTNLNTKKSISYTFKEQNLPKNTKYVRYNDVNNSVQITGTDFVGFLNQNNKIVNLKNIPKKYRSHFSFVDKQGNIWVATFRNGVYFIPKNKAEVWSKNEKIQFIKQVNGKIYVGIYQKGLFVLQNKTLTPVFQNANFQFDISSSITKNTLLYSNNREIYKIENGKKILINSHLHDSYRNSLFRKSIVFNHYIYGNNFKTVNKVNPATFTIEKEYTLFGVSSYSKTQNSLFITTQGGLVTIKNDSILRLKSHSVFSKSLLSSATLNSTKIVIGTDGNGAYTTNGKQAELITGTENRSIENIYVDVAKNIWLATEKGVYKAVKKDNNYSVEKIYLDDDGLISNKTNDVTVKNDTLFVATDIGLSIINLKLPQENKLLNLYVKQVKLNKKIISIHDASFKFDSKNQLSVAFNAVGFSNHKNLQYSYKLLPIHKDFININTPEINFSNLGVNNYELQLKVKEPHQQKITKTIRFNVTPLWYQTVWFKIAVGLLIVFLSLLFNYFNSKRIRKKAKEKAEIQQHLTEQELYALRSQMNPHFVFNSLNAIQYYITENELDLSEKYLVRFSKLVRMFFDFSAKKTISIAQEIRLLEGYLEIEKMRFGNEFNYHFIIDDKLDKKMLIPTMLLQPVVENAVNHGIFHNNQKGTVFISFQYISKNKFLVFVEDDGVGIEKSQEIKAKSIKKHESKSTRIIADRISLLNQSNQWKITYQLIDLTKNNAQGTKVILTFEYL